MYPLIRLVLIAVISLTVKIHAVLLFSFIIVHIILILLMTSMVIFFLLRSKKMQLVFFWTKVPDPFSNGRWGNTLFEK